MWRELPQAPTAPAEFSGPSPMASAAAMARDAGSGCIPGEAHRPSRSRCSQPRYWLFQAARDGCLPCVQRMLNEEGIDVHSTSENLGYTALDFATWAAEKDVVGAQEVMAFLAQEAGADAGGQPNTEQHGVAAAAADDAPQRATRVASQEAEPTTRACPASTGLAAGGISPPVPGHACSPGETHVPSTRRRQQRKYWLFQAASEGCLRCVRHFVEAEGVDPASESDTNGWTALDFAVWAREHGDVGSEEVETYLATAVR